MSLNWEYGSSVIGVVSNVSDRRQLLAQLGLGSTLDK